MAYHIEKTPTASAALVPVFHAIAMGVSGTGIRAHSFALSPVKFSRLSILIAMDGLIE